MITSLEQNKKGFKELNLSDIHKWLLKHDCSRAAEWYRWPLISCVRTFTRINDSVINLKNVLHARFTVASSLTRWGREIDTHVMW